MPSPLKTKTCLWCGSEWRTRHYSARTCNPTCRARLREQEHGPTKGAAPREYPEWMVEKVRSMYEMGHTIPEIQAEITGAKVYNIMVRHGIDRRKAIPRDQSGAASSLWKGDSASYTALHLRVYTKRGAPSRCERCGIEGDDLRYEWANLTGNYHDIYDYQRMCVTCHRRYDAARRRATGMRTSPTRR